MRIICGTDFSTHANQAAMTAATLAARLELPLALAHVLDPSRYSEPSADLMDYLRRNRQNKLQALAERAGRKDVIVETAVIEGSPATKLTELALNAKARFLVLSALGQIAPTQWLAGSVTNQTVQMSTIPTFVIRDPGSLESWLHGEKALKILVGYDYSGSAEAAVRWVGSLTSIAPCDVTIVYVASPANERSRLGIAAPLSPLYYPSALRKHLEEEIRRNAGPMLGNKAEISVKADWGRPDAQMIDFATDIRADLIVVGTSRRRGIARLGSVARGIVHYAKMNVASVPEGWTAPVVQGVHHDVFPVSAEPVASPEEEKDCEAIY